MIVDNDNTYFLSKSSSVAVSAFNAAINNPFSIDKDAKSVKIDAKGEPEAGIKKGEISFVSWGEKNSLPIDIIKKHYECLQLGANANFNSNIAYGQGLMVVKKTKDNTGKITYVEQLESEQPKVFEFLEENNYNRILFDSIIDLDIFSRAYRELIFSRNNKIVSIRHKETCYSRISKMNDAGQIEYHGYSYGWHTNKKSDVGISKLLNEEAPLLDLKERKGGKKPDGKDNSEKDTYRYILPIGLPTPARVYYPNPFFWSIFVTGWDQIANLIPKAKKELMRNKIHIAYLIYINEEFWPKLFKSQNCTNEEEEDQARKDFLKKMDEFLAGTENAGKGFVSSFRYDKMKGEELKDIIIKPLEKSGGKVEGGDWIDDNEEATNMICLAKGNHVSLLGASPGKNKTINGTEARELFIIKQAMLKPLRMELVKDLYIVKHFNGWDPDLHFVIPNLELTTLDQGTGAVKTIGNQKI